MGEMVAVKVNVTVEVAVVVNVEVGVLVRVNGVRLKVGDGGVIVMLGVAAIDGVAVGVLGPGLIIMATHPRQ